MEKWQRRPASILWAPSNIFFQQSTRRHESYKIASAMHTIVFVDWSIEAKIAQVAHESEIFDGFVPTMMQWCDGASTAIIGTTKMTKITVLTPQSGGKIGFSDAKSDAKCCGWPKLAPSWPKLNASWPKLAPSWFKFAPNGPQVGASWPQLGPSQLQVSPS